MNDYQRINSIFYKINAFLIPFRIENSAQALILFIENLNLNSSDLKT